MRERQGHMSYLSACCASSQTIL